MPWSRFTYPSQTRLGYTSRTSLYSVSSTTLGGAANIFSSSITFTADGTSSYRIVFFSQQLYYQTGSNTMIQVQVVDGSGNAVGQVANAGRGDGVAVGHNQGYGEFYYAPTAGSKTINARAYSATNLSGGNNNVEGDSNAPTWLAVFAPDALL